MKIDIKPKPAVEADSKAPEKEEKTEKPVTTEPKPKIGKVVKMAFSIYDLVILVALVETIWWLVYGCDSMENLDMFLGQNNVHRASERDYHLRLILATYCIWYEAIANGGRRYLGIYAMTGIFLDGCQIIYYYNIASPDQYGTNPWTYYHAWYNFIVYFALRGIIYITFAYLHIATREDASKNGYVDVEKTTTTTIETQDKDKRKNFLGKGIVNVVNHYIRDLEKAVVIWLALKWVCPIMEIAFHALPGLMFVTDYSAFWLSLPFVNLICSIATMQVASIGIIGISEKKLWIVYFWIFLTSLDVLYNTICLMAFLYFVFSLGLHQLPRCVFYLPLFHILTSAIKLGPCYIIMKRWVPADNSLV